MEPKKFFVEPENDMLKVFRHLKDNLQILLEYEALQAQITRKKYDNIMKNGFNEIQALQLCKK